MRRLVRPLLLPLLRRRTDEVIRRAVDFRIDRDDDLELLGSLGHAFISGYNTMLEADNLGAVSAAGMQVTTHFRPFFFEGAAMGYLPRGYFVAGCTPDRMERDVLGLAPSFLYLYYVGMGFWYGFRHRRRPQRLAELAPHLDPMLYPLCYDGFGFKLALFDYPSDPSVIEILERGPAEHRRFLYQGFGRALFFVLMDDLKAFDNLLDALPAEYRDDLEFGRALACGFSGFHRPDRVARYVQQAPPEKRRARIGGITWAATARKMNDPAYFAECLATARPQTRRLLEPLPEICEQLRADARDYLDWQSRTTERVLPHFDAGATRSA